MIKAARTNFLPVFIAIQSSYFRALKSDSHIPFPVNFAGRDFRYWRFYSNLIQFAKNDLKRDLKLEVSKLLSMLWMTVNDVNKRSTRVHREAPSMKPLTSPS
ncbi:hypothetical protein [Paraburkholderia tropica]|uniref:hypothetical protein n=1 Tax=Paraburkholderia tropica TaxID=92647 RepID=UPI002AB61714|nr:hypothetical protein [Paraburkholderia tropica]